MADLHGYSKLFTDRPETWFADGYISIGATGAPSMSTVPSGIVSSITRNSTGNYSLKLAQNWYALLDVTIKTEIPAALSPSYLHVQLDSDTVGVASSAQSITFRTVDKDGASTDPPSGSGLRFLLVLKRSSA